MNFRIASASHLFSLTVLIAILVGAAAVVAQSNQPFSINTSPLPAPTGPVNDYVGVIDESTKTRLNKRLIEFRDSSGVEIAVAIVNTTGERPIFDYSLAVARGWGIGSKEDDNPSALLFVAIDDRKYFTQVSKDLEDELPDGMVGSLQRQHLVPEFRNGNFAKGISDTIEAYIRTYEARRSGTAPAKPATRGDRQSPNSGGFNWILCCFILVFVVFPILSSIVRRSKGRDRDDDGDGGIGGSALPWIIGSAISNIASSSDSSSSSWDSGWSSGGSDWGGFGGGGDFGGGGAGGDW
ncbi:MAG TPA: TPM domain-containing protein [Pyrinomonadaceae bacterium]|nr:TPM domain-containing protein [Pyrinomonadaceae bacterium]